MIIGSFVFGTVKPDEYNQNSVTVHEMLQWQRLIQVMGGFIVAVKAGNLTLRQRYAERGDQYLTLPEVLEAARIYNTAFNILRQQDAHRILTYDSSDGTTAAEFVARNRSAFQIALKPSKRLYDGDYRGFLVSTFL